MTPNQGDPPNEPRGRQPSGSNYQQQPSQSQQSPGQYQGGVPQQGQQPTQGQQPIQGQQGQVPQGSPGVPRTGRTQTQTGQSGGAPPQQPTSGSRPTRQQPTGGAPQQPPTSPQQSAQQTSAVPPQQMGGAGLSPQQSTGVQPQQAGAMGMQRQAGRALEPVSIDEIVATDVVTAQPDTPIANVVAKMAEEEVGSVVIVEDNSPAGVVTDRSIALALENTPDVANKQAGDLVGDDVVTGTTEMSVFEALDQLSEETIRRLPIVDEEGSLEGIITLDDLLVLLSSELDKAGKTIREQSPRL